MWTPSNVPSVWMTPLFICMWRMWRSIWDETYQDVDVKISGIDVLEILTSSSREVLISIGRPYASLIAKTKRTVVWHLIILILQGGVFSIHPLYAQDTSSWIIVLYNIEMFIFSLTNFLIFSKYFFSYLSLSRFVFDLRKSVLGQFWTSFLLTRKISFLVRVHLRIDFRKLKTFSHHRMSNNTGNNPDNSEFTSRFFLDDKQSGVIWLFRSEFCLVVLA